MAQLDLEALLRSANTVVEGMLPRTRRLMARISSLPESDLPELPRFRGDFTQDGLLGYLEGLEEWVRTPWRARSRKILQDHGINCDGVPVEILEDSEGVEKTGAAIEQLQNTGNPVLAALTGSGLVSVWLKDGHKYAQERLGALDRAREGFRRLTASEVSDDLQAELLRRAASNTEYVPEAEAIAEAARALGAHGCIINKGATWDVTLEAITTAHKSVAKLTQILGEDNTSVADLLPGKSLTEVRMLLEQHINTCENEFTILESEFSSLSSTGATLGIQPSVLPSTIPDLRREVERLRKICHEKLGDDGMRLLAFLQERAEFPGDLTLKQIENALLALRPTIARAIRGGQVNA